MGSETYHEPVELLSEQTKEMHRAIVSLIEELEAVDWYQQRADACSDQALKEVLLHHRDEEIEHAMMNLEWIRRHDGVFDENMRTYLFSSGAITEVEAQATGGGGAHGTIERPQAPGGVTGRASGAPMAAGGSLSIGSLRNHGER